MEKNNYLPYCEKVYFDKIEKDMENEFSLPEYCPNITRIVKVSAYPRITGTTIENDSVFVEGEMLYHVLYLSDFKGKLKCIPFTVEFSNTFQANGMKEKAGEDAKAYANIFANNVSCKLLNPRHIAMKTKYSLSCDVSSCESVPLLPESENDKDKIEYLEKEFEACEMIRMPDVDMKITEELSVDSSMPQIGEIVFSDAIVYIDSVTSHDGKVEIRGQILFKCIYEAASENSEEGEYISLTKKIPFTYVYESNEIDSAQEVLADFTLTSLTAESAVDSYGENKLIHATVSGVLDLTGYKNLPLTSCEDAFSCEFQSSPVKEKLSYDSFYKILNDSFRLNEKVKTDMRNIVEIVDSSAKIRLSPTEVFDGKPNISGRAMISVLGTKENGELESADTSFNFRIPMNIPRDDELALCRFTTAADVCNVSCNIENGELSVNLDMAVRCAAKKRHTIDKVSSVTVDYTAKRQGNDGAFIIYYPMKEDTVWSVAKYYGVSPEAIREENKLSDNNISEKRILILNKA